MTARSINFKTKHNSTLLSLGTKSLLSAAAIGLLSATTAQAASLEITGVVNEVVGTTSAIPGGGTSANFPSSNVPVGSKARFKVSKAGSSARFADLEVVFSGDNGNLGGVMIARTTNSQGLTDGGTLSILLQIGSNDRSNPLSGTGSFTFNWYEPGTNIAKPIAIDYTTFDIDFRQKVVAETDEVNSFALNGVSSLDSQFDPNNPNISIFDPINVNSTIDDPRTAAGISTRKLASHTFHLGKDVGTGNALFIFEFRDPSDIVTFTNPQITQVAQVPESSSMLGILSIGLGGLIVLKKGSCKNSLNN